MFGSTSWPSSDALNQTVQICRLYHGLSPLYTYEYSHERAAQGSTALAALVRQAEGRIAVMAGGGVRAKNAARTVAVTGVREVHSSAARSAS